jgi:hypothetical protein
MHHMNAMPEKMVRKSVSLPEELWQAIDDFRFRRRVRSEAQAFREVVRLGIEAAAQIAPQPPAAPRKPRASAGRAR